MLPRDEDPFEGFLRQFEPRQPRALPSAGTGTPVRIRLPLAIAALVCIALGLATWNSPRPGGVLPRRPTSGVVSLPAMTIGGLNELLRRDPGRFDSALAEASPGMLPDVRNPNGLLHALAGE
jgi:hypothetical protein